MHSRIKWGFKSQIQLPLLMVWREYYDDWGDVEYAEVLFNSWQWIGI